MAESHPTQATAARKARLVSGHVKLRHGKRGDAWYAKYRTPSGRQVQRKLGPAWPERKGAPPTGYFNSKTANAALEALLTDLRRGLAPDPGDRSGKTFGDVMAEWLRWTRDDKARKSSTVKGYENVARQLEAEFGEDTMAEEVGAEQIEAYRAKLLKTVTEGKLSRRTVQQRLVLLHGAMKRAVKVGWLRANPVETVERVCVSRNQEFNVLTVEQVEAVAAKARAELPGEEAEMYQAAILVAAYAGLRTGELRALRWRDIDFAGASVRVVRNMPIGGKEGAPKSGRGRSVPLIDQAARALDRLSLREHFTAPDDRVFPNAVGGMLSDDALRDAFYEALEAASIDRQRFPAGPFVFHHLRHTFGTLAARIFPLVDVQAFMGHAQIETTMIYAHSVPRNDAARRFTEAVEEAGSPPVGSADDGGGRAAGQAADQAKDLRVAA